MSDTESEGLPATSLREATSEAFAKALEDVRGMISHIEFCVAFDRPMFAKTVKEVEDLNKLQLAECRYLDVGGTQFHISRALLTNHGPHFLSELVSGSFADETDEEGYVFLDRDPHWFNSILAYLRESERHIPLQQHARKALAREAWFYQLEAVAPPTESNCLVILGKGEVHLYFSATQTWQRMAFAGLDSEVAAVVGGQLYTTQRDNGVPYIVKVDLNSRQFHPVTEYPHDGQIRKMVGVRDCLIVADDDGKLASFNVQTKEWTFLDEVRWRRDFALCEMDGRLWVVGGRGPENGQALSTVSTYCPVDERWSRMPGMLKRLAMPEAVVWRSNLVVFGDSSDWSLQESDQQSVEEYNPHMRKWTSLPQTDEWGLDCEAVVLDGDLYVVDKDNSSVQQWYLDDLWWGQTTLRSFQGVIRAVATLSLPLSFLAEEMP